MKRYITMDPGKYQIGYVPVEIITELRYEL